jgi:polysaccharide biosynthesis transport protein
MTQREPTSQGFGLTPEDIISILFKHKWKLLFFILVGLSGAGVVHTFKKPSYQSTARLLIRYVMDKRSPTQGAGVNNDEVIRSPDTYGNTVVNSELEILTSEDLARLTARGVGPDRILRDSKAVASEPAAAGYLRDHLKVEVGRNSAVMTVTFSHPDPAVARDVLKRLIEEYRIKHDEVHRAIGTYELIQSQTDQLRNRLAETEEALHKAKAKAGVLSIDQAKHDLNERMGSLQTGIFSTEAEVESQRARIKEYTKKNLTNRVAASGASGTNTTSTAAAEDPDPSKVATYNRLSLELAALRSREAELRLTYAPEGRLLQDVRRRMTEVQTSIDALGIDPSTVSAQVLPAGNARPMGPIFDLEFERATLAGAEAKLRTLKEQLERVTQEGAKLDEMSNEIARLQRTKELEEDQYRYFQANLERARLDQTLDSGKLNNISPIQEPSFPRQDVKGKQKMLMAALLGPIGFGFALVFALELFLNPSVKRAKELEGALQLPVLATIPLLGKNGYSAPALGSGAGENKSLVLAQGEAPPWEENDPMFPYYEALRDRVVMSYTGDTHKPKIVGVTSCHKGAGVTRVATGMAAALSRDAQRNVLLIGLERNKVAVSGFRKGRPTEEISQGSVLGAGDTDSQVHENLLSLATTGRNTAGASIAQSFTDLMPKLKASDYDYIVFDLPPITQTSGSVRLAGQMERTLLVVESEKTAKESLQKAKKLLASPQTHLAAVLNKTRTYGPAFLSKEV